MKYAGVRGDDLAAGGYSCQPQRISRLRATTNATQSSRSSLVVSALGEAQTLTTCSRGAGCDGGPHLRAEPWPLFLSV
jgi:hypothetical protein